MKNGSLKILKPLLRLTTLSKGVKPKDQQAVLFDERLKLFDFEGQLLQNEQEDDQYSMMERDLNIKALL